MRDRRQCLQAGFSPEQRIFFRRHAIQASGSLFRSFPAFVFSSLQAGVVSILSSLVFPARSEFSGRPVVGRPNSSARDSSRELTPGESPSRGLSSRVVWLWPRCPAPLGGPKE